MYVAEYAQADYGTLVDLAEQRIETIKKHNRASRVAGLFNSIGVTVMESFVSVMFKSLAKSWKDDAIWFRGAADTMVQDHIDLPEVDSFIERIERLKAQLFSARKRVLDIAAKSDNARVKASASAAAAATADLFEALEEFRWGLLEVEACNATFTTDKVATTPDELESLLKAL